MPGTDLMPSGSKETFTGANGSAPNATNITLATNEGSGGGISIQSNQIRIRTGTTALNRTSFRITGLSVSDAEVEFDWIVPSLSVIYGTFMMRSNSAIDTGTCYQFTLKPNDMNILRTVGYSGTTVVTNTHGFAAGSAVTTRVALFGQRIRARTWLTVDPEPTSVWQIDWTDPGSALAAGSIGWSGSSASSGSKDIFFDNIDIHDTITPDQAVISLTGAIAPAGALRRSPAKRFTAAITPAGALTRTKVVLKILTGAITPSGAVVKQANKRLAGALSPTSTFARVPAKRLAGSLTPAAVLRKRPNKRLAGSVTPAGSSVVMFVGRIFGRPGLAVMSLVRRAEVKIRHRKG